MDFTKTADGWLSRDGAYRVEAVTDPWSDQPTEPIEWAVRVRIYGRNSWTTLQTFPTIDGAQAFAAADWAGPIFDDDGACRWCGTQESYLSEVPTGWFGCNRCDPAEPDCPREWTATTDTPTWEDLEAYDDPA